MEQERVGCCDIGGFAAKVWFSGFRKDVGNGGTDTSWRFECPGGSKLHVVAEGCGNGSMAACRESGRRTEEGDNGGREVVEVVERRDSVAERTRR